MQNGKTVTKTRRVRRTEWFSLSGPRLAEYCDHLVCASQGLSEAETNAIEPFDLGRSLVFKPELLAGNLAEVPTISLDQGEQTAREEIKMQESRAIKPFLPGDRSSNVQIQTAVELKSVSTVFLPIWIATYKHKGQVIRLLVNAQTGRVNGQVPTDKIKVIILVLVVVVLICGIVFGVTS